MSKANKDLKRLVVQSAKFRSSGSAHIERSSTQVAMQSHRLAAKVLRSGALTSDARGHVLLATKGINTDELERGLNEIHVKAAVLEPVEPLRPTDIEGFLRNQHEMILLTAIEEAKTETLRSYRENYQRYLSEEWSETKRELLEGLGQSDGALPNSTLDNSLLMASHVSTPTPARQRSLFAEQSPSPARGGRGGGAETSDASMVLDDATMGGPTREQRAGVSQLSTPMLLFSQVVSAMNTASLTGRPFAMLTSGLEDRREQPGFLSAVKRTGPTMDQEDAWRMMRTLFDNGMIGPGSEHSRGGALRWRLVQQSRRFLQDKFVQQMKRHLSKVRAEVRLGGDMSKKNLLETYLKHNTSKHIDPAHDLWAGIYFALRCGDTGTALEYASRVGPALQEALRAYVENQTGSLNLDKGRLDFQTSPSKGNHFCLAVYNIIGHCELDNLNIKNVFTNNDDYVWYSLSLLRKDTFLLPSSKTEPGRAYAIDRLQGIINGKTATHFNPRGDKPFVFFQVLMQAQLFNKAIQYLYNTPYSVDAVHIAVILAEYALIDQDQIKLILKHYLRQITYSDPKTVVSYLQLLKNADVRRQTIREFVLESREYDVLLGVVMPNGQHKEGCLAQLLPQDEVGLVVREAAAAAESIGRFEDALRLFDMCGDYDRVVNILNQQLATHLLRPNATLSKIAAGLRRKYDRQQHLQRVSPATVRTFELLMGLERFFGFYRQQEHDPALDTLYRLNIIPATRDQIKSMAEGFRHLEEPVKRNFAQILLAAMNILKSIFQTRHATRENIKECAQALMTFVGTIQFSVPQDVYSTLVRINCLMS